MKGQKRPTAAETVITKKSLIIEETLIKNKTTNSNNIGSDRSIKRHLSQQTLIIMLLLLDSPKKVLSTATCPRVCECLWRDSKITADCSHQNLISLPASIDSLTQTLNISYNRISLLESAMFFRKGLVHLQRVTAVAANIERIEAGAFRGLDNLVELDLAENVLREIPSAALNSDCASLMSLSLRSNVIDSIDSKSFFRLANLRRLDLSHNRIVHLAPGALEGLEKLQRIYLHNNLLTFINAKEMPPALFGVSLHDNRWHCDCSLRSLRSWLESSNVPLLSSPLCESPRRLRKLAMDSLRPDEFACVPRISPTSLYISVAEGKNVSVVCRVTAQPLPKVLWLFNGHRLMGQQTQSVVQQLSPSPGSSDTFWRVVAATPSKSSSNTLSPNALMGELQVVRQDAVSSEEVRSELMVEHIRRGQNGTFTCVAENKAGTAMANFSLRVEANDDANAVLKLQLEHLALLALAVVLFLIFLLVVLALLLIRTCHLASSKEGNSSSSKLTTNTTLNQSSKMPKHIQMGKGFKIAPVTTTLTAATTMTPMSSLTALNTTSTSAGSSDRPDVVTGTLNSRDGSCGLEQEPQDSSAYQRAMEHIIDDYKRRTLSMPRSASLQPVQNAGPVSLGHYRLTPYYPNDFGLPRSTSTWTRTTPWPRSAPAPMSLDALALWQLEQQQRQLYAPQKGAFPSTVMPDQKYPEMTHQRNYLHSLPPNRDCNEGHYSNIVNNGHQVGKNNGVKRVRVDYRVSTSSVGNDKSGPSSLDCNIGNGRLTTQEEMAPNQRLVANAADAEATEVAHVRVDAPQRAQLVHVEETEGENRSQSKIIEGKAKETKKERKEVKESTKDESAQTKELASPPAMESVASWSGMDDEEGTSSLMLTSPDTANVSPVKESNDDVYRELEEAFMSLDVDTQP